MNQNTPKLISDDWFTKAKLTRDQKVRLSLLDGDIQSAQISLHNYQLAKSHMQHLFSLSDARAFEIHPYAFHYAKTFTCAMTRIRQILEALSRDRTTYPKPVADTIKLAWRKRRSMLESYKIPRNIIEHIFDKEISDKTNWAIMNLNISSDTLYVTQDQIAKITERNLNSVIKARHEIIESILQHTSHA